MVKKIPKTYIIKNKEETKKMRISEDCVARHLGWVVLDDKNRKAYRVMTNSTFNFITSPAYKSKEGEYWIKTKLCNIDHELLRNNDKFKTMEVEYIDHVIYWPEMAFADIKKCTMLLCEISEYLAYQNMSMGSHLWNVTLKSGRPILIDLGDFFPLNNALIYGSITSHLMPPFTKNHTPIMPREWIDNYDEIYAKLNNIKSLVPQISALELVSHLKLCISQIKVKTFVNYWDNYPYQTNMPTEINLLNQHAIDGRPNLCKVLERKSSNTILDLGASHGLYSFFAAKYSHSILGIDYSHALAASANEKAIALSAPCQFALIDLLNLKESSELGGYSDCFSRFKSDGVIAPAVLHHVHGKNKSLEKLITEWAKLSKDWIMLEYIPVDAQGRPINLKEITATLSSLDFEKIEILNSNPSPRKWVFAERKNK